VTIQHSDPLATISAMAREMYETGDRDGDARLKGYGLRMKLELIKARKELGLNDFPIALARADGQA
jgi:hypothetical protein